MWMAIVEAALLIANVMALSTFVVSGAAERGHQNRLKRRCQTMRRRRWIHP